MDKVTAVLTSPTFHDLRWIGSIDEGELKIDEFKDPYFAGIFCLLHKNLTSEADACFEKSASPEAMYILGRRCFFYDESHEIKGMECLNKAYAAGNLDAGYSLARIYFHGETNIHSILEISQILCDELHDKAYNQKCIPDRRGFYSFCASAFYETKDIKKMMYFADLAIKDGCTCVYGVLGSYAADDENDYQKCIDMNMKIDFTKCDVYKPDVYWNIARAYNMLSDYKNAIKFYTMAHQFYDKEDEMNACINIIKEILTVHPEAMTELIQDKRLVIK